VLLFIDTAGCAMYESVDESSLSRYNVGEVQLVAQHVGYLLKLGLSPKDIAVISPYNGQVQRLKAALQDVTAEKTNGSTSSAVVETRTVDGFQGGEREAVVLSLVRSSGGSGTGGKHGSGSIGFLRDDRRLNVAITRSKRHCCVIGDSETLNTSPFVKDLLEWFMEHGVHRSAMEYMDDCYQWSSSGAAGAVPGATSGTTTGAQSHLMKQAERQMQQYLKGSPEGTERTSRKPKTAQPPGISKQEEEDRTRELVAAMHKFVDSAEAGEELSLSSELSKWDRKVVHEQAEKLGIGHRSEGVEGVDRHIIISKPLPVDLFSEEAHPSSFAASAALIDNAATEEVIDEDSMEGAAPPVSGSVFGSLGLDGSGDDDDQEKVQEENYKVESPTMNPVLAELAKERDERQREVRREATSTPDASKKKKNKKKGGQKLGGTKQAPERKADDGLDDLDDMAFLDAQIEKVQTSHGRKIDGKGAGYRTVMNGILMGKPKPPPEQKDAKASSALRTKLKQAQDDRKAKSKKK